MVRCTRFSPIPSSTELLKNERDPRRFAGWNHVRGSPEPVKPFPHRYSSASALAASSHSFVPTPTSPEFSLTPAKSHVTLKPSKLNFSPASQDPLNPDNPGLIYGLMYSNRQALREDPRMIDNVTVIHSSPILQENIHHLLSDHALDRKKAQQHLRYLGIPNNIFMEYIRQVYSRHYWPHLGDRH